MTGGSAASRLVWRLAGHPEPPGAASALLVNEPGVCVMCGEPDSRTADVAKAAGTNFTDQYLYRRPDSTRICPACVWCCSGRPPATLRMWSIVAAPGVPDSHPKCWLRSTPGLCLTNRAATRPVADTLLSPPEGPWAVTVAISGQKHVIPYARINYGARWTVRMENTDVTSTSTEWAAVIAAAATLRMLKHGGDAVREGRPDLNRITTHTDWDMWQREATILSPYVGSPLLDLALWCLTKETINDYARPTDIDTPTAGGRDDSMDEQPAGLSLF